MKPLKVYVSGRVKYGDTHIKTALDGVKRQGFDITYDWTKVNLPKPLLKYPETTLPAAIKMKQAAINTDIFILIWDDSLYGALVEFGMALGASTEKNPKVLFIVGSKEREGIFEVMPEVKVRQNIKEVIAELRHMNGVTPEQKSSQANL